jgi:hypothetical protein
VPNLVTRFVERLMGLVARYRESTSRLLNGLPCLMPIGGHTPAR